MSLDFYLKLTFETGAEPATFEVFDGNCTHNLAPMARAAGVYECLWRPDEHGYETARQVIEPLRAGIARMEADPDTYRALNPSNGWGDFDGFFEFCEDVLRACERYPAARVGVWR